MTGDYKISEEANKERQLGHKDTGRRAKERGMKGDKEESEGVRHKRRQRQEQKAKRRSRDRE